MKEDWNILGRQKSKHKQKEGKSER